MYWYISFLRPPPVSVPISQGGITITPQIANDLRTELLYTVTEISYTWQKTDPILEKPITTSEKLVWSPPESTYKAVNVPLPAVAKPGERWRIYLHVGPLKSDLSLSSFARPEPEILGVWSEPISLVRGEPSSLGPIRGVGTEKGKKKEDKKGRGKDVEGKKQGRITRSWKIGEDSMQIIEQTSFDLDKKIWDSGLGLSGWLLRYLGEDPPAKACQELYSIFGNAKTILEIGSGTGLVSIALGLMLRHADQGKQDIVATDLDSAIELMQENLSLNSFGQDSDAGRVQAKVLDWDEPLPAWVVDNHPELVIAADVTYNTASFPSLVRTLTALLSPSNGTRPLFLLAYKQRDVGERELWGMLDERGVRLDLVDTIPGAVDDGQVEIYLGRAK